VIAVMFTPGAIRCAAFLGAITQCRVEGFRCDGRFQRQMIQPVLAGDPFDFGDECCADATPCRIR
jgi:hypothetical protein